MQHKHATIQRLQAEVLRLRREFEDLKNVDQKIEGEIPVSKEKKRKLP
jgi:hypothetical protein